MYNMQYISLVRVRDTLGLSAFEAGHYFGKTDKDTWLKWESNQVAIPPSVNFRVDAAMSRYNNFCEVISNSCRKNISIKNAYRDVAIKIDSRAEHPLLEHKIAQSALNRVIASRTAMQLPLDHIVTLSEDDDHESPWLRSILAKT